MDDFYEYLGGDEIDRDIATLEERYGVRIFFDADPIYFQIRVLIEDAKTHKLVARSNIQPEITREVFLNLINDVLEGWSKHK